MSMCDRCRVSGCLLNYNGKACENARKEVCPEVFYTNEDRIKDFLPEQMAVFLNAWAEKDKFWTLDYGETMAWLEEPFVGFDNFDGLTNWLTRHN